MQQQQQAELGNSDSNRSGGRTTIHERCFNCGKTFTHGQFVDHLFAAKNCMRKFWEEEEKTHSVRMRHKKRFGLVMDSP